MISDHNGPCSLVCDCDSLADAIQVAREMATDQAPTELEDYLGVDATGETVDWLIEQAESQGWVVVATAGAGEYWTVLVRPDKS